MLAVFHLLTATTSFMYCIVPIVPIYILPCDQLAVVEQDVAVYYDTKHVLTNLLP